MSKGWCKRIIICRVINYKILHRNLVERALRARLVYAKQLMQHAQSFEYLNRQPDDGIKMVF
jgi:hypothetical protein